MKINYDRLHEKFMKVSKNYNNDKSQQYGIQKSATIRDKSPTFGKLKKG